MNFHIIKSVKPLDNLVIEITFANGTKKKYDVKPLMQRWEVFKKLQDAELFNKVRVDAGGYGIVWSEDIDLSSEEIWTQGITINK